MRFPTLTEASKYCSELPPRMSDIYLNGSSTYSSFKTATLHKEFSIPAADYSQSGILQDLSIVWYFVKNALFLYNYETGANDLIPGFSSQVKFVRSFTPIPGIFHPKICYCLLVVTETDVVLFAFDGNNIINTEFSAKLTTPVRCVTVNSGRIYIGGEDGKVYQATYHNVKLLGYRFLRLYTPNGLLQGFRDFFGRKKHPIIDISPSPSRLVALSNVISVYNIQGGLRKILEIPLDREYAKIQLIEDNPLLVCCIASDGSRDFFTEKGRFLHKTIPIAEHSENVANNVIVDSLIVSSTDTRLFFYQKSSSARMGLFSFNSYQLRNFSRIRPVENFEVLPFYSSVRAVSLTSSKLSLLTDTKVSIFNILDSKRLVVTCKPQELYELYKSYGDIEFMVKYYDLASSGEDVSKMSGICHNINIKNYALFIFIYSLIKPVYKLDLSLSNNSTEIPVDSTASNSTLTPVTPSTSTHCAISDANTHLESIVTRLKLLKKHIPKDFTEAHSFIDEVVQTRYYVSLLNSYGIQFKETLESILTAESNFKTESLNALLSTVSLNQDIDPLLKTMKNKCPLYLPYSEINMRRGLDVLRRGEGAYLQQSLEYFLNAEFDRAVVQKYNELGYFYGSVMLIRKKTDFSYEADAGLLKESVKCKKAMDVGLQDTREMFLYPFFEALVSLEKFSPCCCCVNPDYSVDLMRIDNPFFEVFLKDLDSRNVDASNPKGYNLYWKYLLAMGKREEAVEVIISLCSRSELKFSDRVDLLEQALTIASCCHPKAGDLRARIKQLLRLSEVQSKLMARDPSTLTSQLLTADELFNDYCYKHADLGICVLDVVGFKGNRTLRNLFTRYLEVTPLATALEFIASLSNNYLPIIIDLISEMSEADESLGFKLEEAGFTRAKILEAFESGISSHLTGRSREVIWQSLEKFDSSEFEKYKRKFNTSSTLKVL